jgi:CPA2 family monovalent cation:H+ antiporter-2
LFGDAANSEILRYAGLDHARALVITVPDEASTGLIVSAARQISKDVPIIARAASADGIRRLSDLGADNVIHPELEGGLEILRITMVRLGLPLPLVEKYTDAVRRDHYDISISTSEEHRVLRQLIDAAQGMEISWFQVEEGNALIGQTLASANIRARTGASVVAILRKGAVMANPKSLTEFDAGDSIGLIGDSTQISTVERLLFSSAAEKPTI